MEPNESFSASSSYDPAARSAINSVILEYYKKFGRKRDLEQYFSLSTAQSEVRDPSSLFWRRMKAHHDSSDSGEKPSESSTELCRISVKCSFPEQSSSSTTQDKRANPTCDSESPPIITEEQVATERQSDDESIKSEGQSLKSGDVTLDTSLNKPHSPTSSVTSQRKLEWDSLADVGYANESDRKASGSSLSTLERLALLQQYTNSDNKENSNIGQPSAHSTFLDNKKDPKKADRKNVLKQSREIHQRDMDTVEVNLPQSSCSMPFSVNLTKHISFNVGQDGGFNVERNERLATVHPQHMVSAETVMSPEVRFDKEIQTSFSKSATETNNKKEMQYDVETGPVVVSLNTIRRRIKRRKRRTARKKPVCKKSNTKIQDRHKNVEQVSEAESFEYMPGHIYKQNQMKDCPQKTRNSAGNKSSLESSGGITTESSKSCSFTKDLEKSIKLLNEVLQRHNDDSHIKKQLVRDVVRKLVKSNYKDDESATEFLSGLSYNSKRLDLSKASQNYTTTSTSDVNNSGDTAQRPKKSILRMEKFDSKALASNSQSAPNLPTVSTSDVVTRTDLAPLINLESEASIDKSFIKTSSEEIYQKYIEARKKEEAYKKHLKDKSKFLKQKLVGSDSALRPSEVLAPVKPSKLKDLIKDLIRNNYDDGSGDASKLEGGPDSNSRNFTSNYGIRKPRSHSVFTLSSGNSDKKCLDKESKKMNLRKRLQDEIQATSSSNEGTSKAAMRKEHFCCCPHHTARCGFTDSSTQVDIEHCQSCNKQKMVSTNVCPCKVTKDTGNVKMYYTEKPTSPRKLNVRCSINKSSDLDTHREFDGHSKETFDAIHYSGSRKTSPPSSPRIAFSKEQECTEPASQNVEVTDVHPQRALRTSDEVIFEKWGERAKKVSQSSQTNVAISIFTNKLDAKFCDCKNPMCTRKCSREKSFTPTNLAGNANGTSEIIKIHETTRCLQTEISIDPKKSDPQLHDIVIVNSKDLVQVISEHIREVSKSKLSDNNDVEVKYMKTFKNSETQFGTDTDIYTYMSPCLRASDKSLTYCKTKSFEPEQKHDAASQSTFDPFKQLNINLPTEYKINTDSYAIPLEGTNMTLRVSIATKDANGRNMQKAKVDHSPGEEISPRSKCRTGQNTNVPDNLASCEECPPRVKRNADDMFGGLSDKSSFKASFPSDKIEKSSMTDQCCEDIKINKERLYKEYPTYPSTRKKQFLRTNTEPALLENKAVGSSVAAEPAVRIEKKIRDMDTQACIPTEEKSIETKSNVASKPASERTKFSECSKPVQKAAICSNCNANKLEKTVEKSVEATDWSCQIASKQPLQTCTKLMEAPQVADKNSSECIQPKKRTVETLSKSCATCFEDTAEKPMEDKTQCQCRTETVDPKLRVATLHDHALTLKASEKANCTKCSQPLQKIPGCGDSCQEKKESEKCQEKKSGKPKIDQCTGHLEATSSLPTSARSTCSDPVMEKIQEITKRYGKKDLDKSKRKKCFNEIISVLNYLLETEDKPDFSKKECVEMLSSNETSDVSACCSKVAQDVSQPIANLPPKCTKESSTACSPKKLIDRAIQLTQRKSRVKASSSDSSDIPTSSDVQECATVDAATCKILNKIKKECEKYHQRRCKSFYQNSKCESSSTSAQCGDCKKSSHCVCRSPKSKGKATSPFLRLKKKCVAYNLILQTSESVVSDPQEKEENKRQLENVVVKVPAKCCKPLPEYQSYLPHKYEQAQSKPRRPKSATDPLSVTDDFKNAHGLTVKDYLEKNRPDFIESSTHRQSCLKMMEEHRSNQRELHRRLLSMQLQRQSALSGVSASQLRQLARELGIDARRVPSLPKFISEREMKKHSEKIFKKLPEQMRKKEELRNENIKKTNLLMASIFNKNLQKKTLRGSVNFSNYNTVIKI